MGNIKKGSTKTRSYQKYVFDFKNRRVCKRWNEGYLREDIEQFDFWFQDDTRFLHRHILLSVLSEYNFDRILDIGCGKGMFTHLLKKKNNWVVGVDIATMALKKAQIRYPDIEFCQVDLEDLEDFKRKIEQWGLFDLVVLMEVLSYLENWQEVVRTLQDYTRYVAITLYFPPEEPIGYVKRPEDLRRVVEQSFDLIYHIKLEKPQQSDSTHILFGVSKKRG